MEPNTDWGFVKTVKVKATDPKNQGPFVVINESDYDEKVHGELYVDLTPEQVDEAIANATGGEKAEEKAPAKTK